jgi:hypothetical protein
MIALVTTYFLVLYILFPGVLFRFVTSWFVELRLFERTRTQEATFAVQVALLPFFLALLGVWFLPLLRQYPFPIEPQTYAQRRADYHRITTLLTTSDSSKLLVPTATNAVEAGEMWPSLNRILRRQARFLAWYYFFTAVEAFLFGFLASKYGDWKTIDDSRSKQPVTPLKRLYNWAAPSLILPNISEWYMLLTNFSWPKQEKIFVRVDILQSDGLLYKGTVVDYFIDSGGKLTGIQLEAVNRFDRQAYHDAQKVAPADSPISTDDFWRNIPSSRFYIGQSSITNLNVRFVPQDQSLIGIAESILAENNTHVDSVSVWRGYDSADPDSANPDSQHPDIYS